MSEKEWLEMGYKNGLITKADYSNDVNFNTCFLLWLRSKMNVVKPQSLDRIEVTYNKYFNDIKETYMHLLNESATVEFINAIIFSERITKKQLDRVMQIIMGVITFAYDTRLGCVNNINWQNVKRNIAYNSLKKTSKKEYIVSLPDRKKLFYSVLVDNVYPQKRHISMCICLNFFLGLRLGELASLRWCDIDFINKYVLIHSTYTKSYNRDEDGCRYGVQSYYVQESCKTATSVRRIPLFDDSIKLLKLIRENALDNGYYSEFVCYDGTDVIISKNIERCIRKLCSILEINTFTSHMIRKTFASELHMHNVPTKVISDLMGHSEIETTEKCYIVNYRESLSLARSVMQECLSINLK